ncbi:uncharacterized protein PADG_06386 [Paracoccidioides brasiliensis Pb18]|uniref:Uncharacterized protein n=1 Tax=Paracoccidioides brasiliensis (strain Pb18) TaxID=502780 RepID=C1GGE9_PARBD|nr:uncharacterized protein PADG_06386 [Paracoccidioides brasiliensis Pb18]EEH50307.2 hypothetical protein PADG_06386 [Paracoccidioides brasiliensis Pb18]
MVNLRSGGTPDLTKEYAARTRRNRRDRTPENRTPEPAGSLPTQNTDNESNNAYDDLVNKMPENTDGQSGQVSGVSEQTLMKREIAKLQREVERMRASREALPANASSDEMSEDLANYLQKKGRTTTTIKILAEFREQVRNIKKPVILTGSANYPMWREEILLAAKQSETDDILEEKQFAPEDGASEVSFYDTLRSSVVGVYSMDDHRRELFREACSSDRAFIARPIAILSEYTSLGAGWASFIRDRMDHAAKDTNAQDIETDFMGLCRDILSHLPAAGQNTAVTDMKNPANNAQDSSKKNKSKDKDLGLKDKGKNKESKQGSGNNTNKTCHKAGHLKADCWTKYPEKRPADRKGKDKDRDKDKDIGNAALVQTLWSNGKVVEETWVLDSGSGAHATPLKDIVEVTPQKSNVMLEMADGSTAPVAAVGRVPKLEVNLMSFGKLARKGYTFKQLAYSNNHSTLLTSPGRMTSLTAYLNNKNIYVVEKPPALRDLVCFVMPNGDFEPAYVLRSNYNPLLELSKGDIKILEYTMVQWHQKAGTPKPSGYIKIGSGS